MSSQATPGFSSLQEALSSGRFDRVAQILDDAELQASQRWRVQPVSVLVLVLWSWLRDAILVTCNAHCV